MDQLRDSQLGKASNYPARHDAGLLFPIARDKGRRGIGLQGQPEFAGCDIWHAWELSWLNTRGRPEQTVARFQFDCHSPNLIESKSFKLYLNSLAQTRFASHAELRQILGNELARAAGGAVDVQLIDPHDHDALKLRPLTGQSLDQLDIDIDHYGPPQAQLLQSAPGEKANETLTSGLFRSNCPVTGQPDWASVQIHYQGPRIDHASLLRYLISFRLHSGFHEQCVEQIFTDIQQHCGPQELDVYACFTRRGGLDINPWRSSRLNQAPPLARDPRQ